MTEESVIRFQCPKCGQDYELPSEFIGQIAECTECDTVFEILGDNNVLLVEDINALPPEPVGEPGDETPELDAVPSLESPLEDDPNDTIPSPATEDTGTSETKKLDISQTNTVKLSRAKMGMVPNIKDSFKLDVVQSMNPAHSHASSSVAEQGEIRKKAFVTSTKPIKQNTASPLVPQKKKKSFWSFLAFWKK